MYVLTLVRDVADRLARASQRERAIDCDFCAGVLARPNKSFPPGALWSNACAYIKVPLAHVCLHVNSDG